MDPYWLKELKQSKIEPITFFYGTETFLMEEMINYIKDQVIAEGEEEGRVLSFDLEEVPIQTLILEAETPSLFGDSRLIIGQNATFLTSEKSRIDHLTDRLISYLQKPYLSNIVILITPSDQLDKRKKVVKAVSLYSKIVYFRPLEGNQLLEWLISRFKRWQITVEKPMAEELIRLVGKDLRRLHQECMKIATYVGKKGKITISVLDQLVVRTLEQSIFKLIDHIANRRIEEAFKVWMDLMQIKEEPIRILALITRQFRLMLKIKFLAEEGMKEKEMATLLKAHPYSVKLALKQGNLFSETALRSLLAQSIQTDQDMKAGKVDKRLAIDQWLFNLNKG